MAPLFVGKVGYFKEEVSSTNDWALQACKSRKVIEGTAFRAGFQTKGKGQRGNSWESQKNVNLLVSFVFHPHFLKTHQQFKLVMATSLAIKDVLDKWLFDECQIKWPNDLYVNDLKIAGILIESIMKGDVMGSSVVGVGVNINQNHFSSSSNATSLNLETGKGYDLDLFYQLLSKGIEKRYLQLKANPDSFIHEYQKYLYRKGIPSQFILNNKLVELTIIGVDQIGQLQLRTPSGDEVVAGTHQVKMII